MSPKLKDWFQNRNKSLIAFAGTFIINSLVVWLMIAFDSEWVYVVVCVFLVPLFGGSIRGISSTLKPKKFWLITGVWGIILLFAYVPLYGFVMYDSTDYYLENLGYGVYVTGFMLFSSFIGYMIRKRRERKMQENAEIKGDLPS